MTTRYTDPTTKVILQAIAEQEREAEARALEERYTDPARVAAFLRCTLAPAGVTLRDEGGRLVIVQPDWRWLQPEVDLWQAGLRAALQQQAQREATR